MLLAADDSQMSAVHMAPPHPLLALPFVLLLGAIAVMPFLNAHWWERYYAKVSVALGAVAAAYYLIWRRDYARLGHVAHEYISFMALVGSLFVIAGGIHLRVKGRATPLANCVFLLLGGLLANVIGTTGASVLLIRPFIRMNGPRVAPFHIVFFIFIVSNVAGCLTPIGDPPLFLGYLKGVPFWWVLEHCWPAWLTAVGGLLAAFYVLDRRNFLQPRDISPAAPGSAAESWHFDGLGNLGFLALALAAVFIEKPLGLREALMLGAAVGSYFTTPRRVHEANRFSFGPIEEVGWLFAGIFLTMTPPLDYLNVHAASLGIDSPTKFFWLTGALSGVLDNAPTYLAFLATAFGNARLNLDQPADMGVFLASRGAELLAISLGAVFFGAMTYIGNGPNFMVKAIAEQAGVQTPNFFQYIARYSLPVLLPLLLLVWLLFFSPARVF